MNHNWIKIDLQFAHNCSICNNLNKCLICGMIRAKIGGSYGYWANEDHYIGIISCDHWFNSNRFCSEHILKSIL